MATIAEALNIGLAHHQAGRLQEAEEYYRQILSDDPNNVDAWHYLGVIAHEQGRDELSRDCILRALALKPDFGEANHNLGIALYALKDRSGAVAAFRRAIAINS